MTDIEQALSAEEWADGGFQASTSDDSYCWVETSDHSQDGAFTIDAGDSHDFYGQGPGVVGRRHALAALCLHGQPFGFTRERLCRLRKLHQALVDFDTGWIYNNGEDAINDLGSDLDRIEALLPPENK